jgi:phage recombination protein Bet
LNAITKHEGGALALPETELLQVLQSSLYPGAAPASIKLVIGYCKAAGLDPMQKPVHIVPMWDGKAGQMRDVVMPGVGLYRTQAARTGCAGISEPEFGPDKTETIGGQQITFPTWCRVTVKRRQANGAVDEFTAREFWMENYAVKGGKEKSIAPNAMWTKRPYGQIAKCAEAQALRKAFPEIGSQPTAEEMEGKGLEDGPLPMAERVQPAPVDPRVMAEAQAAADKGRESFAQWWKAAKPEQRRALADSVPELKERTERADAANATSQQPPADGAEPPAASPDPWLDDLEAAEGAAA